MLLRLEAPSPTLTQSRLTIWRECTLKAEFKVGDLVQDLRVAAPLGIVTKGDYHWKHLPRVDVLVEGKEFHCHPEWLEKVNEK